VLNSVPRARSGPQIEENVDLELVPTSTEENADIAPASRQAKGGRDRWQIPVAIASLLLGIAVSLQFRASSAAAPSPNSANRSEVVAQLRAIETERDRLSTELAESRKRMAEIQEALGQGKSLHQELVAQYDGARLQAGLTALKGPGIVVRLSDSPRQPGPDEIPYDFIVHDIDLSVLVNELWASGAEAVEVNGQRIVARSSIRCVGPTVLVNANRVASPFIVKTIGDVDHLEGGLKMPGGFLDSMSRLTGNGGEVVISRMREVQVSSYQGSLIYRYAVPVDDVDTSNEISSENG
jgi:uncharacterized protein YlxW (UPF0749 family)